jgi:hypothetical protein
LQEINKYVEADYESKKLCFLREKIEEINYEVVAHNIHPVGNIKYSSKIYYNKHMNYIGVNYFIDKTLKRYERSALMRSQGFAFNYINDVPKIIDKYNSYLNNHKVLSKT